MLRPIFHYVLSSYGIDNDNNKPWYKQKPPTPREENADSKILWDIPIHIDKAHQNGANRPDITVQDKVEKRFVLIEGTVCNLGQIQNRNEHKTEKYTEIRKTS